MTKNLLFGGLRAALRRTVSARAAMIAVAGAVLCPVAVNAGDCVMIMNRAQLEAIADGLDGSYALGADIDLGDAPWTPLGTSAAPFTGTLEGNGHRIAGLAFSDSRNSDAGGNRVGLFRYVKGATLDGIRLEGVSLSGYKYVGALAGEVQGATAIRNCSAEGVVSNANEQAGLLVGRVSGAGTTFTNCVATGAVVSAYQYVGGLVGYASATVSFEDCTAAVSVSGKGSGVGGFIGQSSGAGTVFADCTADGDVVSSSSDAGGFVGTVSASNAFTRCTASGAVSGAGNGGGFVGSAMGANAQFVECCALGPVKATGSRSGGFSGQSTAGGVRYALCRALGSVASTAPDAGGFVGYVSNSNDIWRCMGVGSATASSDVGGFVGNLDGANAAIRECFSLGDVVATQVGDGVVGGFVGLIGGNKPKISDSYCLGAVKAATRVAGGFAGRFASASAALTRCYAASAVDCAGTYVGAFAGDTNANAVAIDDCAALCDGVHAAGTDAAAASAALPGVAEFGRDAFLRAANFVTWLAVQCDDGNAAVWLQSDGKTQPYLAWSATEDGKLAVYEWTGGSAHGSILGANEYHAPGSVVEITAVSRQDGGFPEGFFVEWTGSTPYGDPTAPTTTIALDNHRIAAARFGKFIASADELDAVRNDLAGVYGLAGDIDLSGREWTPIGSESKKFSGAFYGNGHAVRNLTCTNSPSNSGSKCRGLFGCTAGATLDGVRVEKCDVAGYQYVGALVGRICDGTTIAGCSASGRVSASSAYAGGLVGACDDGAVAIRDSAAATETTGGSNVGGFIGRVYGSGASVIADCRADGFACGSGYVGGFVGSVGAPLYATNCMARGDVTSTGHTYGGFVGQLSDAGATNVACWCSGAVWGTAVVNVGAFVGQSSSGALVDCSACPFANGRRPFCGNPATLEGGALDPDEVKARSRGWPKVAKRSDSAALTPISTAEELFAITNASRFAGAYVLTADIDLGGAAWTPVGNPSAGFTGEFYGRNHAISNFTVNAAAQCAGLFGRIAGGRVSGVRAYGTVADSSSYVGGFAGRIESCSMVDDCSFVGDVAGSASYVGGFVGQTYNSPDILRCCAVGAVAKADAGAGAGYVGGFAGQHGGGWISDSYALSSVDAGKAGTVGGFAGSVGGADGARITTSYCSASIVTNSFNYIGAFGGNVSEGSVTESYYDAGETDLLAQGQGGGASADCAGITPVADADMTRAASFPAFDFAATWKIEEGETTPYLLAFTVQKTGYELWLEENGLPGDTAPDAVAEGVPYLIRYVFDRPTGECAPLTGISFNGDGDVVVSTLPIANDEGVKVKVLASTSLTDWSQAEETEITVQSDGKLVFPRTDDPTRFFKLSVSED